MNIAREKWLKFGCKRLLLFIGIGIAAFHVEAQTNNDAYLKSLAGEAEGLSVDSQTEVDPAGGNTSGGLSSTADPSGSPSGITGGLSREEFEKDLQNNYIGSYLFYKRLSDSQKDEVFASYQADPSPDSVREKILQVSKQK